MIRNLTTEELIRRFEDSSLELELKDFTKEQLVSLVNELVSRLNSPLAIDRVI